MPKGMFTQGICVLLDRAPSLDQLESALGDFDIYGRHDTYEAWEFGGPTLIVGYRPDANGFVAIDVVDRSWPDDMGDPKEETMIFGAWTMGHFGPFTYPGSLERAAQQCWGWESGSAMPEEHKAFIRIRSSYAFGAQDDDPIMPSDYEPLAELEFVTDLAVSLLDVPGALCYFNPNGEILRDVQTLRETLSYGRSKGIPPLDAWSNIRLFKVDPDWVLMDTVGNDQLDIPDVEACFHSDPYDLAHVDNLLRNVSLYLLQHGEVFDDGDTIDGPGNVTWRAKRFEQGICDPPRRVLRLFPVDDHPVPPELEQEPRDESSDPLT